MTTTANINKVLQANPVAFRVTYRPEFKDGVRNWSGEVFTHERYHITGEFTSGGYPSGFQVVVDGAPRRFSYWNVISVDVGR